MIIGLTGSIGSGKSTASARLSALGAHVLDADAFSRAVTEPGGEALPEIEAAFGTGVFAADASLDRRGLAALVFSDADKRHVLNEIIHPLVLNRLRDGSADILKKDPNAVVVWDVPLLIEVGWQCFCDEVWLVSAAQDTRVNRIIVRDRCTRGEALARIQAQMSDAEKARYADAVIENDGDLTAFLTRVDQLFRCAAGCEI